ncbi:MAG TPA: TIGR02594 family protein [Methylococcaceae bacterium]|nr:TIGR02594 family protein [Methylococcaceae bacterium]
MNRIEEKFDIPRESLEEKIGDFEFDGAVVSVIPQPDGHFTLRAVFMEQSGAPSDSRTVSSSPLAIDSDMAPWLTAAKRELSLDVGEIAGSDHNPRIVAYHATTSLSATDDETPWCSSFINFCMEEAGVHGTGSALARSWTGWGRSLSDPLSGCVVVLNSLTRGPEAGHVGFYMGEKNGKVHLLGGNQGNRVSIAPFEKTRVIAYRWPD